MLSTDNPRLLLSVEHGTQRRLQLRNQLLRPGSSLPLLLLPLCLPKDEKSSQRSGRSWCQNQLQYRANAGYVVHPMRSPSGLVVGLQTPEPEGRTSSIGCTKTASAYITSRGHCLRMCSSFVRSTLQSKVLQFLFFTNMLCFTSVYGCN